MSLFDVSGLDSLETLRVRLRDHYLVTDWHNPRGRKLTQAEFDETIGRLCLLRGGCPVHQTANEAGIVDESRGAA